MSTNNDSSPTERHRQVAEKKREIADIYDELNRFAENVDPPI